jgi:hypothetical protein
MTRLGVSVPDDPAHAFALNGGPASQGLLIVAMVAQARRVRRCNAGREAGLKPGGRGTAFCFDVARRSSCFQSTQVLTMYRRRE